MTMCFLLYAALFGAFANAARVKRTGKLSNLDTNSTSNAVSANDSWTAKIYEQPPSTVLGCVCDGPCHTSFAFKCNAHPFCTVKSKDCAYGTASWSVRKWQHYDYCTFKKYDEYEKLTAKEKSEILLHRLTEDTTSSTYPSLPGVLTGIMGESVRVSFESSSDVFPHPRKKYIHGVGVVAPISFKSAGNSINWGKHKYTGLFQGAEYGFIRFSSAKCPSASGGITPGAGIKLLRDGKPSANFVAMHSLDGQPCENGKSNFFEHPWKNHINRTDNFGLKLIAAKFWQASYCPLMVGLSDVAATSDGSKPVFPFELELKPAVSLDFPCDDLSEALAKFGTLEVGKTLFRVEAKNTPFGSKKVIGEIVLEGKPTTSKFGDEEMFFKHQYMEEDFALHPEWLGQIDKFKDCGMSTVSTSPPPISKGCSSPFKR
eukprot:gnl/MRDRNA2_/MRDRNA2_126460_c0_seq1.p1 gnl/MRDRNA2_/MRDRNA2_126460_c0~~gnl/MRDRNA2_/MRDRNA2_126460_c0_seq1.p1  ORF type:complete len:429 (-),score=66.26 gnl/MRDRNA2_/MRDRNA2_126460_c0_seq1:177-1463(-)